jgi:uncharacterized protein (DUF58 family)
MPTLDAAGPYCDLPTLLRLRAAAGTLRITPPSRALSQLSGPLRSNVRGRGIEFEEVRAYEAGDDIRNIDWRVTARSGRAHTKLFREERERPVYLLVDQRATMFFGSRRTLKSVQAVHAAALLAWATLDGGDRLGGLVLGEHEHHEVRPRRNRHAVLAFLRLCHDFNRRLGIPGSGSESARPDLANAITGIRRVARPGSLVVIISDFHGWDEAAVRQLHLLARHTEIAAINVFDPLERELPAVGRGVVSDGRRRRELDTSDRTLLARYAESCRAELEALREAFRRLGAPFIQIATDEPALDVLARYYRRRKSS